MVIVRNRARLPVPPRPRGMTLLELLFVVAILGVIVAGITKVMVDLDKTNRVRTLNIELQGEGRTALQVVARDIRHAALGSTLGVIWTQDALGNVVQRPAVQIFDGITAATAGLDVKAGSDAVLVVGAWTNGAQAAAQGTMYDSTQGLSVTQTTGFSPGNGILAGPYREAAWSRIATVTPASGPTPGSLQLTCTQNVYPRGKLDAGSMVRAARSRLYYLDANDELIQLDLTVPRAPASAAEIAGRDVIARGIENLQVTCETDSGVAVGPCPAALSGDPVTTEAAWAFGTWGAGGGGRFNSVTVGSLRTVILETVVRSRAPLAGQNGDAPIPIDSPPVSLLPGGSDPTQPYLRRAYRLPIGVRNVSLGAF